MLTRRENLLIRPWQELRYINHRKKVLNALPAIDNTPPPYRQHVFLKLKRSQKEAERCSQIISDNFTLLQHLTKIMNTTRINNAWEEPPPNFLNRVGIYTKRKKKAKFESNQEEEKLKEPKTRKERCYGCSPHRYVRKEEIPENRIPFEPPKQRISRRKTPEIYDIQMMTSSDVIVSETVRQKDTDRNQKVKELESKRSKMRPLSTLESSKKKIMYNEDTQKIKLTHDGLTIKVSFPPKTGIEYNDDGVKKVLQKEFCECRAFPRIRMK